MAPAPQAGDGIGDYLAGIAEPRNCAGKGDMDGAEGGAKCVVCRVVGLTTQICALMWSETDVHEQLRVLWGARETSVGLLPYLVHTQCTPYHGPQLP